MTRQTTTAATRTFPVLALLVAAVPSCMPLEPPPMSTSLPRPTLSTVDYRHAVHFATDRAELTSAEAAALRAFVAGLPADQRLSARVLGHADLRAPDIYNVDLSARRAAQVADHLRRAGLAEVEIATVAYGESRPVDTGPGEPAWRRNRRVEVLVTGAAVVLPGCPDWSREPGFDPLNLPLSNLGCANAVNLGLMVADPGDLASRRPLSAADGTREAEAIVRYRTDKVKQIEADIIQ